MRSKGNSHPRRKDVEASPHINRPVALADVRVNEGGVDDVTVRRVAVLHDTTGDTETTVDGVRGVHPQPEAVFDGLSARRAGFERGRGEP